MKPLCLLAVAINALVQCAAPSLADQPLWPSPDWPTAPPAQAGLDAAKLDKARDYALSSGGSGLIVHDGQVVLRWGDQAKRYDLKSTTKSIGAMALGLAVADGKMRLHDKAADHHPSLAIPPQSNLQTGWIDQITIEHLATQTAGFEKPGGYTKLAFRPGTKWSYSDGGPNWLAECVTLAYSRDVADLMFERVFRRLGISPSDLTWRSNAYRDAKIDGVMRREFGSGVSANVDAMARIGYLHLCNGRWKERQIIPESFVRSASTAIPSVVGLPVADPEEYGDASDHYGLLWWNNADSKLPAVPRDAYWSWGLYDSLILVVPSLDLVVARAGESWERKSEQHYDVLKPFFEPITSAVKSAAAGELPDRGAEAEQPPYPPSRVISGVDWAPAETIVRRAKGSDNWPITWGDDDRLYAAYGDGRGFAPLVERKLSLGLCAISGPADDPLGENLRAPTVEREGDGDGGPKASGILMVDGTLYLLVRNVGNSQLAWSADRGRTWNWSDWKFTRSFGCPTFLNLASEWDVGPGETSRFPTKWMSDDGRTAHLVFSGEDCFSVRQAILSLADDEPSSGVP